MLSNLQLFLLALVLSIFNWLMTFLGSSLVYFVKSKSQKLVSIALGLAAGIMIAATFFSLLLPAVWHHRNTALDSHSSQHPQG